MPAMIDLVLDAPGKNSLGTELMDSVIARLREADGAPLLLTGAKDAFSAGLNLKEVHGLDAPGMDVFLRKLDTLISTLFTYPGPTVAAVNGHAIAGGCILALACDHRVCTPDARARIGLNEVALGLQFPPGILRLLKARLAPEHLNEVALGARLYAPQDALRLGLVDEVSENPLALARDRLAALAKHPKEAYAATKRALRGSSLTAPEDAEFLPSLLPSWVSPEVKARIAAILNRK